MHRPAWLRLFIGLWGLWFNAALLEAPGVHACAVHSNVAMAGHHHGSADMSMPMPEHTGHEQASSSHSSKDSAPQCSCLSACCGVAAFVVGRAPAAPSASYRASSPARIGIVAAAPIIERPHERPFANGPPSLI